MSIFQGNFGFMGQRVFISVFFFFLGLSVFGQNGASFGLRIGGALTEYHGEDLDTILTYTNPFSSEELTGTMEQRLSMMAGLYINTDLSEYFWLKHEFYWVNKGATIKYSDGSSLDRFRMGIDFYPLLATFHFNGLQVFAGPYGSAIFLKRDTFLSADGQKVVDEDFTEENFLDYGAMGGIEYQFNFGLNVGFRYFMGFSPADIDGEVMLHHQGIYGTIGFTFGQSDYY